jgi:predicted nucleic acid-binding protein
LIGILLIAKKKCILKRRISSIMDELRNHGYWLSDEIVDLAITLAKEK